MEQSSITQLALEPTSAKGRRDNWPALGQRAPDVDLRARLRRLIKISYNGPSRAS